MEQTERTSSDRTSFCNVPILIGLSIILAGFGVGFSISSIRKEGDVNKIIGVAGLLIIILLFFV